MKDGKRPSRVTIFHQLINAEDNAVTNSNDLRDEAFALLAAASETTGHTMTVAVYWTLSNPEIYRRVHNELKEAFPDSQANLPFLVLEKLPYLVSYLSPESPHG